MSILKSLFSFFGSMKLTVVCFFLLFVLTFVGTIAQVEQGLYIAQHKYFYSLFFPVFGFLPMPGAALVMWVLFINLSIAFFTKFAFQKKKIGIWVMHTGILFFLMSAFITFQIKEEAFISLFEGETTNVAQSYHEWEIAAWKYPTTAMREINAYTVNEKRVGEPLDFPQHGVTLTLEEFYPHVRAFKNKEGETEPPYLSGSNIHHFKVQPLEKEPTKHMPGLIGTLKTADGKNDKFILFGGESKPLVVSCYGQDIALKLQKKRIPLPFQIKLLDFKKETHPGISMAKGFESTVDFYAKGFERKAKIYMNHPLTYKDFTLFQASYALTDAGQEQSTFAVVKNAGKYLPYIATFWVLIGLVIHFLIVFAAYIRRRKGGSHV